MSFFPRIANCGLAPFTVTLTAEVGDLDGISGRIGIATAFGFVRTMAVVAVWGIRITPFGELAVGTAGI
jgi:hypothetical protein